MKISFNGKLHIKKRTVAQVLTLFVFFMPFFIAFFQDILRAPSIIRYLIDAAWLLGIFTLILRSRITIDKKMMPFLVFVFSFVLYTVFIYVLHYQSPFYYLWGFRNNFRFYFAFILFCIYMSDSDAKFCLKFMDIVFYINAVVSLFQFFVLGYKGDFLGGIFGTDTGCNAAQLIIFTIIVTKSILQYMNKEEPLWLCIFKCVIALILASMAEVKFFFVVFVVVLTMATFLTTMSLRKIIMIIATSILLFFSSALLTALFGESSTLTLENIINLATTENYSSHEDLGRGTAVTTLSNTILISPADQLFGLGLGNCDTSAFAICNTPFYQTYADLNYTWFSSAFLFLETGYVGLLLFLLFFLMCFVFAFNHMNKPNSNKLYCQMSMIISVFCVMLFIYNSSLRTEYAYMVYFVLALPLIATKSPLTES